MRGPRTAMKSGPRSPQLEKALATETKTQHSQKKKKKVKNLHLCTIQKQVVGWIWPVGCTLLAPDVDYNANGIPWGCAA